MLTHTLSPAAAHQARKKERALDWLERSYERRNNTLMYLAILPAFAPLHEAPRFQALVEQVGLR